MKANLPAVVERCGRQVAGIPMTGDPTIDVEQSDRVDLGMVRRACQYAAAMLFPGRGAADMRDVDAYFLAPATVVFVRADASQAEIGRFTVPERVMAFDPVALPLRLSDDRGD